MPRSSPPLASSPLRHDDPAVRLTWDEICATPSFRDRWLALDECRYDASSGKAVEAVVVDVDSDLATLCERVRDSYRSCEIVYCRSGADAANDTDDTDPFGRSAH